MKKLTFISIIISLTLFAAVCFGSDGAAKRVVLMEKAGQAGELINLYHAYTDGSGMGVIKNALLNPHVGGIRNNQEVLFSEGAGGGFYNINIFRIDTGNLTTVATGASGNVCAFSAGGKVLFVQDGLIKETTTDGQVTEDLLLPEPGWAFTHFQYSRDGLKIITASEQADAIRVHVRAADGSDLSRVYEQSNAETKGLTWNVEAKEIFLTYNDLSDWTDRRVIIPLDGSPVRDLSAGLPADDVWWGAYNNLYSITDGQFYDALDGGPVFRPEIPEGAEPVLVGIDRNGSNGYLYMADRDGANLFKVLDLGQDGNEEQPTVLTTIPHDGQKTWVAEDPIHVVFSEPMDSRTITVDSFKLRDVDRGEWVDGIVSYNEAENKATFNQDENLWHDTNYTATLTTGIANANGVRLVNEYRWSFITKTKGDNPGGGGGPCFIITIEPQ